MSETPQNIFTDLVEILQVIITYINDPFEIMKLLNTNRNFREKYVNDNNAWKFLINYVYGVTYKGNNAEIEFFRIGVKRLYSENTTFRELPEKYQWLAYILYFNDNNWLKKMEILTSKDIEDAIKNYNTKDDFIERVYINPVFSDDKMTLDYLTDLLPLMDEYGPFIYLEKTTDNWEYIGPLDSISLDLLFSINSPLDVSLNYFKSQRKPKPIVLNNFYIYNFDKNDIEYLTLPINDPNLKNNKLPTHLRNFKKKNLDIGRSYGLKEILSEFIFIINNIDYSEDDTTF